MEEKGRMMIVKFVNIPLVAKDGTAWIDFYKQQTSIDMDGNPNPPDCPSLSN